jgi:MinD-like ATPase involved in chromosome partitioning or flagellar assembly
VLAKLPLVPEVRVAGDAGRPIVLAAPDHAVSNELVALARLVEEILRIG